MIHTSRHHSHPMPTATARPASPSVASASAIDVDDLRERLVAHRLYALIDTPDRLRWFMQHHVFAVWDFQSLLKALQQRLTCTTVPWVPTADPAARRMINEIVLDEESDELPEGGAASHFELYLDCMQRAAADTAPIERLLEAIRAGEPLSRALADSGAPAAAAEFVKRSFAVIESGSTAAIAAVFTYGREDVIPDMFRKIVGGLAAADPARWERFRFYLDRHIEHDEGHHGPLCRQIVARLCGSDASTWAEAATAARECLEARLALWDAVASGIEDGRVTGG
jgi:hypothetical protein